MTALNQDLGITLMEPSRSRIAQRMSADRGDLLPACLFFDIAMGEAFPAQVPLDQAPVLNEDDGLAFGDQSRSSGSKRQPADRHGEQRDGRDDDQGAGDRVITLGDALLDEVTKYDEQDQVKRL